MPVETAVEEEVLERIEDVLVGLLTSLVKGSPLLLEFPERCWRNGYVDKELGIVRLKPSPPRRTRLLFRERNAQRFGAVVKVLCFMYHLVRSRSHASKRDLYYTDTELFRTQVTVNDAVDDVAALLRVPSSVLNVGATCKGIVAGDLQYIEDGTSVNVLHHISGRAITGDVVHSFSSSARFVLVVEKDATFTRLLDDGVPRKLQCVMVTGKGYPCVATRRFLHRLWEEMGGVVPFYGLADADPFGLHIISTYVLGSRGLLHENEYLAVPSMRWIGLTLHDVKALRVPAHCLLPLTEKDRSRARTLMAHPGIVSLHADWVEAMRVMLRWGFKAELQALSAKSISYLSDVYLPSKIPDVLPAPQ
eukprot:Sspe_Gene.95772::Locus_68076_Transcript_1_1_Confidence_1.000_Length_1389::g.95772::m.95772/K10878/SPO11; meiotic recombination protein SPO11